MIGGEMEAKYIQSIQSIRDKKTDTIIKWDKLSIEKIIKQ